MFWPMEKQIQTEKSSIDFRTCIEYLKMKAKSIKKDNRNKQQPQKHREKEKQSSMFGMIRNNGIEQNQALPLECSDYEGYDLEELEAIAYLRKVKEEQQ